MALLALLLAGLTWHQTDVWASEAALWTRAHSVAPTTPRPLIGLAWVSLRAGRLEEAERWLDQATAVSARQTPPERVLTLDSVDTTRAVMWMRRGKLVQAARLMAHAPEHSERWALCQQYRRVCALADSPSLP